MATTNRELRYAIVGDARDFNRTLQGIDRKLGSSETRFKRFGQVVTGAFTARAVVGFGKAIVGVAAQFDSSMRTIQAVTGASAGQMRSFRKEAMDMGIASGLGARQAAKGITELAKGGLTAQQILSGGLKGALSLAVAGEMDLGDAAVTTANALNLFKLNGDQASHVADALAKAANDTTADVSDFALALSQGGGAAKTAGLSFDETTAALEALALSGVKGSDAGTSLKTALTYLAKPTVAAAQAADVLGIKLFDAQGNMKPLPALSKALRDGFQGLTKQQKLQAASTIAGSDGMRTLLAIADTGPKKLAALERGLGKQGTAADLARKKNAGFEGSMKRFQASMENLGITVGTALLPKLTKAADAVAKFADQMRTGRGAGGKFVDTLKDISDKIKPVVKFFTDHPKLVAIAVGAWAAYKTASFIAINAVKVSNFRKAFFKSVPVAAEAGAASGTSFSRSFAATSSTGVSQTAGRSGRLGLAMSRAGKGLGAIAGIAIVAEMSSKIRGGAGGIRGLIENIMPLSPHGSNPGSANNLGRAGLGPVTEYRNGRPTRVFGSNGYPLSKQGKIIGRPYQGTHTLGNWQSDNAIDIATPIGTAVLADEDGSIVKVYGGWHGGNDRFDGFQVTLKGKSGRSTFYTHLKSVRVKQGDRVSEGQIIGFSGAANGVAHLHIGLSSGNPVDAFARGPSASNRGGINGTGVRPHNRTSSGGGTGGPTGTGVPTYRGPGSAGPGGNWKPCILTYYKPSLGGINSDGDASTYADGSSVDENHDMVCAAPSQYPFGTQIQFTYKGRSVTCVVRDRGGAITLNHFDLIYHAAQILGITSAGRVSASFKVVKKGSGKTRTPITQLDVLTSAADQAGLTKNRKDDLSAAGSLISYWRRRLSHARATGNPRAISTAAQGLKSARDYRREAQQPSKDAAKKARDKAKAIRGTSEDRFQESMADADLIDGGDGGGITGTYDRFRAGKLRVTAIRKRIRDIKRRLKKKIPASERVQLKQELSTLNGQLRDLNAPPEPISGDTAPAETTAPLTGDDFFGVGLSIAGLNNTDDPNTLRDDLAITTGQRDYHQGRYNFLSQAFAQTGNADIFRALGDEASAITTANDSIKSLTDAINANTDVLDQQRADLATELKRQNDLRAQMMGTQNGQFALWFADLASGQIAGRSQLQSSTPGTAGLRVRF